MHMYWAFLIAQKVKNLPRNAGQSAFNLWVRKKSMEKGMTTYSSILA